MRIKRLALGRGSRAAEGTTVIIDVFRAFSCEPILFDFGVREIVLEGDIDRCLAMRGNAVLVGESDGWPIPGFDLTNSPFLILRKGRRFFRGRSVIHRTTSGVTGALSALPHSDEVLLASFLTARATADYVLRKAPDLVSIVAMGTRSVERAPEDDRCGDYIESLLTGRPYDHNKALLDILRNESAQKFLRGDAEHYPKEDPVICLQRDLFDFTLKAEKRRDVVVATPVRLGTRQSRTRLKP
jgi:2-phosphosulfolactate phosphatase